MARPSAQNEFRLVVQVLQAATGLSEREARRVLRLLGERVARLVLMRGARVVWPGLGTFRIARRRGAVVSLPSPRAWAGDETRRTVSLPPMVRLGLAPSRRDARRVTE